MSKHPLGCSAVPQIDRPTWLAAVALRLLCCTGQQWHRVEAAYQRFAPYRDSSMDRWHRKTMLMTGSGALGNNLKALNQSLSARVCLPGSNSQDLTRPGLPPSVR